LFAVTSGSEIATKSKVSSLVIVYIGNHWQWWKQMIGVWRRLAK